MSYGINSKSADNTLGNTGNTISFVWQPISFKWNLTQGIPMQSSAASESKPCTKYHTSFIFIQVCLLLYWRISALNILAIDNSVYLLCALHVSHNYILISPNFVLLTSMYLNTIAYSEYFSRIKGIDNVKEKMLK